jgi:uncharacterized protein with HEPN domain
VSGKDEVAKTYSTRTVNAIEDFLDFSEMASRLIARPAEELLQETNWLAAEAVMHRLGEAVNRMDPQFVLDHPELGLRKIKDARNWVAHDYHQIKHEWIFRSFEIDLPETVAGLKRIIR